MAFVTDKGKWIFHSLHFSINIDPSAFSYVFGKALAPCTKFTLNYIDDIMIFLNTWEEHLEAVFKWLKAVDLKIKHSKCEFFKTEVHYLGFLVGVNGVQPLPEKVAANQTLLHQMTLMNFF